LVGATVTVAHDHGSALRRLGVGRREFVADVINLFETAVADVRDNGKVDMRVVGAGELSAVGRR
jgi:hypothetical protein